MIENIILLCEMAILLCTTILYIALILIALVIVVTATNIIANRIFPNSRFTKYINKVISVRITRHDSD